MAKDFSALASSVVELVGGPDNIKSVAHCITRLRFVLVDQDKADTDAIKKVKGVMDVVIGNGQYQVVIGPDVSDAYDAVLKVAGAGKAGGEQEAPEDEEPVPGEKKNPISLLSETVTALFMPVLGPMSAVGLIKAILIVLVNLGLLDSSSGTYLVLYAAADAFFYFIPFALAISAAERFKTNKYLALAVVGVLLYSTIVDAYSEGTEVYFLGIIPVTLMSYSSSVIPAIFTVYLLAKLEKVLKKVVPKMFSFFLTPALCVLIMVPLELIIIGPISMWVGNVVCDVFVFVYELAPYIAAPIFAAIWPVLIIFGAHWAFNPIILNNFSVLGYDWISPLTWGCNFAMAGACLGVFLKTKNAELKELAGPNVVTALFAGITEPAIYGVNLKYKKPFICAMIASAVCGLIGAYAGIQREALVSVNLLTIPALMAFPGGWAVPVMAAVGFFGACILTYFFGFNDSMLEEQA